MRDIAFLVYPGYSLMALAIVAGFEVANEMVDPEPYELHYVSETGGPIRTSAGRKRPGFLGVISVRKPREVSKRSIAALMSRKGAFDVIEFWLENRLMIEVVSPAMAREYEDFLKNAQMSVMNDPESLQRMRATHIKETA